MKDIRLSYDAKTDTLSPSASISTGSPATPTVASNGGTNPKTDRRRRLECAESSAATSRSRIGFAPVTTAGASMPTPIVVAGVPANKASSPAGSLDGFNVATVNQTRSTRLRGLAQAYGVTLTNNLGARSPTIPRQAHPDFEFTIANFSKIPGPECPDQWLLHLRPTRGPGPRSSSARARSTDTLVGTLHPSRASRRILQSRNRRRSLRPCPPVPLQGQDARSPRPSSPGDSWPAARGWRFRRRIRPFRSDPDSVFGPVHDGQFPKRTWRRPGPTGRRFLFRPEFDPAGTPLFGQPRTTLPLKRFTSGSALP